MSGHSFLGDIKVNDQECHEEASGRGPKDGGGLKPQAGEMLFWKARSEVGTCALGAI